MGIEPPEELVHRYLQAMSALDLSVTDKDRRLLRFTSCHQRSIGFVDGALALTRPSSVIRKKLLILSAILEATPQFADVFLPVPPRRIYGGYVGGDRTTMTSPRSLDLFVEARTAAATATLRNDPVGARSVPSAGPSPMLSARAAAK